MSNTNNKTGRHTAGPWTLNNSVVHGSDGGTICTFKYPIYPLSTGDDEYSSNARLIAAAPELLEIAKAYRNLLKTSAHTEGEVATYAHIENVLAKATGGAE
jgi:hypothetical protein